MTLEEKAGQLSLMASAWGGGAAAALNPPSNGSEFPAAGRGSAPGPADRRVQRQWRAHGADHADGGGQGIAAEDPADLRRRHHPRPPHHLPGAARRSRRASSPISPGAPPQPRRSKRPAPASTGPSRRWSTSPATSAGAAASKAGARTCCSAACSRRRACAASRATTSSSTEHMLACIKHFARLRRGGIRASTTTPSTCPSARCARSICQPYKAGVRRRRAVRHGLVQRDQRRSRDRQPLAADRAAARRMGFPGLRRLRLHRRRGNDRGRLRQGRPRRGAARLPRRRRHEHAERPLSQVSCPTSCASGEVPEALLDQSVRRVLAVKAMLGLFDDPFRRIDEKRETQRARCCPRAARWRARRRANRSSC